MVSMESIVGIVRIASTLSIVTVSIVSTAPPGEGFVVRKDDTVCLGVVESCASSESARGRGRELTIRASLA